MFQVIPSRGCSPAWYRDRVPIYLVLRRSKFIQHTILAMRLRRVRRGFGVGGTQPSTVLAEKNIGFLEGGGTERFARVTRGRDPRR